MTRETKAARSLPLFPTAPYVPWSDTSKQAAASIEPHLARLERIVFEVVARAGAVGLTAQEIEETHGIPGNTVRPRLVALCRKGMVRDSGERRNTRSGRRAVVWKITP